MSLLHKLPNCLSLLVVQCFYSFFFFSFFVLPLNFHLPLTFSISIIAEHFSYSKHNFGVLKFLTTIWFVPSFGLLLVRTYVQGEQRCLEITSAYFLSTLLLFSIFYHKVESPFRKVKSPYSYFNSKKEKKKSESLILIVKSRSYFNLKKKQVNPLSWFLLFSLSKALIWIYSLSVCVIIGVGLWFESWSDFSNSCKTPALMQCFLVARIGFFTFTNKVIYG